MIEIIFLVVGFAILIKASEATIDHARKLSDMLGISEITIGFVLLAIATSLPEMAVTIIGSFNKQSTLVMGNIIGSNIANIALVFGIMAIYIPFRLVKKDFNQIVEALVISSGIGVLALILGRLEIVFGIVCIIVFGMLMKAVFKKNKFAKKTDKIITPEIVVTFGITIISIAFVLIGAKFVIDSALIIANNLGIIESVIGASLIAIGTSLPEIVINITCIRKGEFYLAIGNILGSIIANITLILGIGVIINPIILTNTLTLTIISMLGISFLFILLSMRKRLGRLEGIILIIAYLIIMFTLFSA